MKITKKDSNYKKINEARNSLKDQISQLLALLEDNQADYIKNIKLELSEWSTELETPSKYASMREKQPYRLNLFKEHYTKESAGICYAATKDKECANKRYQDVLDVLESTPFKVCLVVIGVAVFFVADLFTLGLLSVAVYSLYEATKYMLRRQEDYIEVDQEAACVGGGANTSLLSHS